MNFPIGILLLERIVPVVGPADPELAACYEAGELARENRGGWDACPWPEGSNRQDEWMEGFYAIDGLDD